MLVIPIAATMLLGDGDVYDVESMTPYTIAEGGVKNIDELAEFAGRNCYQAWERKRPETATNQGYLNNIINQGHFSVLEHGSVTFYVEGVSRSLTHELIRHRHLSFSELSQRYVNMEESETVVPPLLRDLRHTRDAIEDHHAASVKLYDQLVWQSVTNGATRKQAREAARSVLPGGTDTKIVVTGNLRAWRDVLAKRWHVAADAEIQEFAGEALKHLRELAPNSVQDIPEAPYE